MRSKILIGAIFCCGLLALPNVAHADRHFNDNGYDCIETSIPVTVNVDGRYLASDVDPFIYNQRTLIPFRAIGDALGAKISWNADTQTASATLHGRKVDFILWNNTYYVDGIAKTTDVAPIISGNRTFLPLRAFSEAFGVPVKWNPDNFDVTIDTPAPNELDPYISDYYNLDNQVKKIIYKYYVDKDETDSLVGSYHKVDKDSRPYGTMNLHNFIFWSKLGDGTYQVRSLEVTDLSFKNTDDIALHKYDSCVVSENDTEGWELKANMKNNNKATYYKGMIRTYFEDGEDIFLIHNNLLLRDKHLDKYGQVYVEYPFRSTYVKF